MRKAFYGILGILMVNLTGCTTPRQMTLFADSPFSSEVLEKPLYTIAKGDVLQIDILATDANAVSLYNSAGNTFVVSDSGTVTMPILGAVKVEGKNTEEAIQVLTDLIKNQVRNPIVHLLITNATVTILGEVNHPSCLPALYPITFLEALGTVGGLTQNARCNNVLVQRYEQGKLVSYRINLLTDELFRSPCYYLQKGDVVIVAPLHSR